MGYMGIGMQRWISNMKPRKFLSKRSKPDGGGMENEMGRNISDYYHLKPNNFFRFPHRTIIFKYLWRFSENAYFG